MGARSAAWVTACASASVYTAVFIFSAIVFHGTSSASFMSLPLLPLPLPPSALALTVEPFETSPLDVDVEKKAQADELSTAEPIDYSENTEDTGPHTFGPPVRQDEDPDEDFDENDREDDDELRLSPETESELDGGTDTVIGIDDDTDIGSDVGDVGDVDGDEFDAAIEESNDLKRATSNEIGVLVILDAKNASDVKSSDDGPRRNQTKRGNGTASLNEDKRSSNKTKNRRGTARRITAEKGTKDSSGLNDGIRSEKRIGERIDTAKGHNGTEEDTQEIIAKVFELPRSSTVKSLGSRKLGGQMQTIEGAECNTQNSTIYCLNVTQSPENVEETSRSTSRKNSLIRITAGFVNETKPVKEIPLQNSSAVNDSRQGAMNHSSLNLLNSLNRQEGAESNKRSYHADETQVQAPVEEIVSYDYGEIAEIIIPKSEETYGSNNPPKLDRSYRIQSYSRPNDQSKPILYQNYPNAGLNSGDASKPNQDYSNYAPRFNTNGHQTSQAPPPTYSFYGASEDSNSGKGTGPSTEFEGYYYDPPPNPMSQNEKLRSGIYDFTTNGPNEKASPGSGFNSVFNNRGSSDPDSRHFPNSYGPKPSYDLNLNPDKLYDRSNPGPHPPYRSHDPVVNRGPNLSSEIINNDKKVDSLSKPIENFSPRSNSNPNPNSERFSNGGQDSHIHGPKTDYDPQLSREKSHGGGESDWRPSYDSQDPRSNHDSGHGPAKLRNGSNPAARPYFEKDPKSNYNSNPSSKKSKGSGDSHSHLPLDNYGSKYNDYDINSNLEKSRGSSDRDARPHLDSEGPKSSHYSRHSPDKSHGSKSYPHLDNYNPNSDYPPGLGSDKYQGGGNSEAHPHHDSYGPKSSYDEISPGPEKSHGNIPDKKPVIYEFFETPNSKTWKSHESIPIINPSTDSGPPIVEIIYHRTNGVVYEDDDEPTPAPEIATTPSYDDRFSQVPKIHTKNFEPKIRNKNRPGTTQNSTPKKGGKHSNGSKEYSTDELIAKAEEINNSDKSIIDHEFPVNSKEINNSHDFTKSSVDSDHSSKSRPKDSDHSRKILGDVQFSVNAKVTDLGSQGKQIKSQNHPTKTPNPRRKPSTERNSSGERIRFPDSDEGSKTRKKAPPTKGPRRDKSSENLFTFPKEDPFVKTKGYDHDADDFDLDEIDESPAKNGDGSRDHNKESPSSESKKKKKSKGEQISTSKDQDEIDEDEGSKKKTGHRAEGKEVREGVKKGEKGKKEESYETKKKGEEGKKENKFDDGAKYVKGQSTKGRHEVHKKDEFSRKRSFFDEHHENDQHEKEGGHEVSQKNGGGIEYQGGKNKAGFKEEHRGREGKRKKGTHHKGGEGKEVSEEESEKEVQGKAKGMIKKEEEDETKDFEL